MGHHYSLTVLNFVSVKESRMVKKTKVQSKRLESLRNIVLGVLYSHLQAASCELSKASVGLLCLWLLLGKARSASRDWRMGENEVHKPSLVSSRQSLIRGCVSFQGHDSWRPFVTDAVPPAPYSFRSQRRQCLPLQIIRNRMIPGRITSRVDFFYLCPMSINYSVIPLSLWSPFLGVPSVPASVWLFQVKYVQRRNRVLQPALAGFKLVLLLPSCVTSGKSLTLLGLTLNRAVKGSWTRFWALKNSILCMQLKL